ncbi:MAG: hypothetical protein K5695_09485 [Oscillospiraceae bacterium]|nr:hypothetical protein [Oscillospiraceae bacterium]
MKKRLLSFILAFSMVFSNSSGFYAVTAADGQEETAPGMSVTDEVDPGDGTQPEGQDTPSEKPSEEPSEDISPTEPQAPQAIKVEIGLTFAEKPVYYGQQNLYWKDGTVVSDYLDVLNSVWLGDELSKEIAQEIKVTGDGTHFSFTAGKTEFEHDGKKYAVTYFLPEDGITLSAYTVDESVYKIEGNKVRINDDQQYAFCISSTADSFDPKQKEIELNKLTDHTFYLQNIQDYKDDNLAIAECYAYSINYFGDSVKVSNIDFQNSKVTNQNVTLQMIASIDTKDNVVMRLYYGDAGDYVDLVDPEADSKKQDAAGRYHFTFQKEIALEDGQAIKFEKLHAELLVKGKVVSSKDELKFKDSKDRESGDLIVDKIAPVIENMYSPQNENKVYIKVHDNESGLLIQQNGVAVFSHKVENFESDFRTDEHYKKAEDEYYVDFKSLDIKNGAYDVTVIFTDRAGNTVTKHLKDDFGEELIYDGEPPKVSTEDVEIHLGTKDSKGGFSFNETPVKSIAAYKYGVFAKKPIRIDIKVTDDDKVQTVQFLSDNYKTEFKQKVVNKTVEETDADGNVKTKTVSTTVESWYSVELDSGTYRNVRIEAYDTKKDRCTTKTLAELLQSYYSEGTNIGECESFLCIESTSASATVEVPQKSENTTQEDVWYGIDARDKDVNGKKNGFTVKLKDDGSGIASVEILDNGKAITGGDLSLRKGQQQPESITSTSQSFTGGSERLTELIYSIPLSVFADGKHNLIVKVTDNAGNVNTYTEDSVLCYDIKVGQSEAKSGYTFYTDYTRPNGTVDFVTNSNNPKVTIAGQPWFNGCETDGSTSSVGFQAAFKADADGTLEQNPWRVEYTISNADGPQTNDHISKSDTAPMIDEDGNAVAVSFNDNYVTVPEYKEHKLTVVVIFVDLAGNKSEPVTLEYFKDLKFPEIRNVSVGKTEDAADKIVRILTFGIYSNFKIKYTVEASDAQSDSGLSDTSACISFGSTYYTMDREKDENGICTYAKVLDAGNENVLSGTVTVTICDQYGLKRSSDTHYTDEFEVIRGTPGTSGMDSTDRKQFKFMIEKNPPTVNFAKLESDGVARSDGQLWFKDDHDINFTISDDGDDNSGISSVKVYVNDSKEPFVEDAKGNMFLTEEETNKIQKPEAVFRTVNYVLSTDNLIATHGSQDGRYVIRVVAEDYAGNQGTAELEYHIDKIPPHVDQFSFSIKSADNYGNTDEYPDEKKFIEYLEYGYYFHEAFTATVHVSDDAPSSGLHQIKYRLVSYQNGEKTGESENTAAIDGDGNASFDIPKDFKGQIYVKASDNVGNESDEQTPRAFVVDTADLHGSETHIEVFGLDNAGYKDSDGHPLYDRDVKLTVKIIDKQSGIREIKYKMESELENQDEKTITIGNTGNEVGKDLGDGWKVTAMDANLVTEVARDYGFNSDNNGIMLSLKMTDRANNSSEKSTDAFSIDKTAPVIDVAFSATPGNGTYYREARTAIVTVTERNFDAQRIEAEITNMYGSVPSLTFKDNSKTEHVAELTFLEGEYTFSISGSDLCNHAATVNYSGGNEKAFIVDLTNPVETDNFDQFINQRENSFNVNKEMTFTITEHNFIPEGVNIHVVRVPAGQEFTTGSKEDCTAQYISKDMWKDTGDTHTLSFTFAEDYVYQVSISTVDASGRSLAQKTSPVFEIDKTAPVLKTPNDLEKIVYTSKDTATSAKPIVFEDKNLAGVKYTVVSYRMKRDEDKNGYDMDITSKEFNIDTDSVVIGNEFFNQDGIYEVKCTALDTAGNASKQSTHTFIIQRDTDFLVYIPESSKENQTGLYEFNEKGIRSAEFKDIRIIAYLAKDKGFEVQVDGTTVTEPDIEVELDDRRINQVDMYDVTLKNSFVSNNYGSEEIDTDLTLNAVATGGSKDQIITLGHIYIDNVKPAGEYESALTNLGFFDGFYGMESRVAKLEGVSTDIDVNNCEIILNNETLRSDNGGFTYDEAAHTITFVLKKGYNEIRPTLVDMAGNVNTLDVVKNVYVGGVFARWWFLFVLGGLIVAAIPTVLIILAVRRKKYGF